MLSGSRDRDSWSYREEASSNSTSGIDISTIAQQSAGKLVQGLQQASTSPFLSGVTSPRSSRNSGRVAIPADLSFALPYREAFPITREEARLVHYYKQHLGRWLDGVCPARQFTIRIPTEVKHCPILLQATICFAAHHSNDKVTASLAYQRCITLLIERLSLQSATHDEKTLCAIVILRFYEQLTVPSKSGSDREQHLAGSAAILRASQIDCIDPTVPTLREASFWVYVRQCLYNATIDQQPPNINFSLRIEPDPTSLHESHPLDHLRLETAWANQITWHCACVTNFCFDETPDRHQRMAKWEAMWQDVQSWHNKRPLTFDPIWSGHDPNQSVFPTIYFAAEWHLISFGYYHICCMLLLAFKPGPRFVIRNVRANPSELKILEHAYALCGSCKCAPDVVAALITLCHTVFVWAPLFTDPRARAELIEILSDFEKKERWPTAWIVDAVKREWGTG
ncbi:hypothetical protein DM02DRAFT_513608 [Periconia macrospinosa]|uniref:Transcription factor domain-containing protein n=1 Tax=Periconia macrospinosa TaxID=97972 RepID=A0A2V1E8U6_9PLEO|nr:hypothetical protein DM02DRAFT_513608 [Periconia macrospinosa]